ncbi:type I glyceraldehyde-3-phosphate dehydrogenase [Campylobacter fetus]|uniref:Glyceraldehyde-3-phosphate dehydrogenase n=1 Tax=Campylobacter fetus subsp. testudinum TaxID=1507806 RepID=A0AAX0HCP9_CAMFE|nr:type I glyceraldehyde-3-phosphate dehydrogenase [Campylobacter fetus]AGZ82239.1 glyceraldehyde 3-phosphate dehydrogenase A [Campylobacter fetus subsp. testudinum 03-427]AJB45967.1 glyceraldehyde-3-phosphate dehydrogenase [Campylobacter fetus subsp. testudinum]ALV65408.1 glyceraldehyde 3-phosphate dehydrogenase A [Campylobacter fetus subsp. testudinum Sp3]AVK81652.1 type I glyceraldehyde-3-phosphate dehydrogenase [Campylobacter fetus subsp. testudinum]EAI4322122.1 type I glyceraldehyde-3-pho
MALKIAINGFGRIGRCAARIILNSSEYELAIINDTAERNMTRYLLKYDSVHGEFNKEVNVINDDYIEVEGKKIRVYSTRDIGELDLSDIDVVLECTGKFLTTEKCEAYLKQGAKKVVMSAPAKDDTPTFVLGVNSNTYKGEKIVSNASCTTNCLGPVTRVLEDLYGIQKGLMTTIHAYTNGQSLVDVKCRDFRRSRAAAQNIIPTSTGAAKAMKLVMPSLNGKLHGQSVRVPVPNVSMVDLTAVLGKSVSKEELNEAFVNASKTSLKGIMAVDFDERVSSDFNTSSYSSIVAADLTQVICGDMIKVMAWYDNEWGYTSRLIEMAKFISER